MQPRSVATGNTKSMIDGGRYSTSVVDDGQHATQTVTVCSIYRRGFNWTNSDAPFPFLTLVPCSSSTVSFLR